MKKSSYLLVSIFLCSLLFAGSDPQECVVEDEEEYAVIAAVLFPNDPEVPEGMTDESEQDAYRAVRRVHLDGFHGSHYLLRDLSMVCDTTGESTPDMSEDFNSRNAQPCKFIEEKLQALLGPGESVRFSGAGASPALSPGGQTGGEGLSGGEVARLSRPGFNKTGTRAVVDVDLQAGYEMGVGYRVYLEKSGRTGKWILVGADRTRIY